MTTVTGKLAHRQGFTFAELIIGLLLLALIGGATAAVAAAISRGWQVGTSTASSSITISRTLIRIQDKVQRAKALGECRSGSLNPGVGAEGAALFFWREDVDGDGKMQLEETQILEHDPVTKELVIWDTEFPDPLTRVNSNGPFATTMLSAANAITQHKARPYSKKHTITRGVRGAVFNLITPTAAEQRPQFDFQLKFDGPNVEVVECGTSSPRSLWKPS